MLPFWLLLSLTTEAQSPAPATTPAQIGAPLQGWDGPISQEMVTARTQAVQERLKVLDQSGLAPDDLESTRTALQQQLNLMSRSSTHAG